MLFRSHCGMSERVTRVTEIVRRVAKEQFVELESALVDYLAEAMDVTFQDKCKVSTTVEELERDVVPSLTENGKTSEEEIMCLITTSLRRCKEDAILKETEEELNEFDQALKEMLEKTHDKDPQVRKVALRKICPCRVREDVKEFWDRIVEMSKDEDANVRYQAMHNLCDGSPESMEKTVVAVLEGLHNDPSETVKRRSRQVLTHYRRTGKWNIM